MHREYDLIDESLTEFSQDICSHTHTQLCSMERCLLELMHIS